MAWLKIIPYVAALAIGFGGGLIFDNKVLTKPCPKSEMPDCPDCNCNCPQAVSLQSFDENFIRKVRGNFVYSPTLSDVKIVLNCSDSVLIRKLFAGARK